MVFLLSGMMGMMDLTVYYLRGASSDREVVAYLAENILSGLNLGDIVGGFFGCSTIASENQTGEKLFGRNFDWENCEAMIVASYPENGYASLSTVNMDFITQNASGAGKRFGNRTQRFSHRPAGGGADADGRNQQFFFTSECDCGLASGGRSDFCFCAVCVSGQQNGPPCKWAGHSGM